MESLLEPVNRAIEQLLGRYSGPMHLRLILQPVLATFFAVRAGLRDAKGGRAPFLWSALTQPEARKYLVASGWKDVGKVFLAALVLDSVYQFIFLHGFYPVQTLVVAVGVALVPYLVFRGPVNRFASRVVTREGV